MVMKNIKQRFSLLFVLGALFSSALFIFARSAQAATLLVPEEYAEIQDAVNNAVSGDEIIVSSGTYSRVKIEDKDIVVRSATDEEMVVVEGLSSSSVTGGPLEVKNADVIIEGISFQNSWNSVAGVRCYGESSLVMRNSIIENNHSAFGGLYINSECSLEITTSVINDNYAMNHDLAGGFNCYGKCVVKNCIISDNSSYEAAGDSNSGAMQLKGSELHEISSNVFYNNVANAGAVYIDEDASAQLDHNIFYNNIAYNYQDVYGIITSKGNLVSANNIITNNLSYGASAYSLFGEAQITNDIVWNNESDVFDYPAIVYDVIPPLVMYSNIEGGWEGEGNIDEDPMFADPDNTDYSLQQGSPCIDAGDPTSPKDPDGTVADMGALYFHQVNIDINRDGKINLSDVSLFSSVYYGTNNDPELFSRCDFNIDGQVDDLDDAIFKDKYNDIRITAPVLPKKTVTFDKIAIQ